MISDIVWRTAVGTLLACTAVCGGVAMAAAEDGPGGDEIDVSVDVSPDAQPGVLAMTVSGTTAQLVEEDSTPLERRFVGELPQITVTDTRDPADIPPDVVWYVLGTASDFTGDEDQAPIPAHRLGWIPRIVGDDAGGLVFAGEEVPGGSTGPGLVDSELLASTVGSAESTAQGDSWSATAELVLTTDADIASGQYRSTITLSLFE